MVGRDSARWPTRVLLAPVLVLVLAASPVLAGCTGAGGPGAGGRTDFIAYDERWLGEFYERLGDAVVYFVVPHEFGHAVQAQLGTRFRFGVQRELQADCYAGAFVGDSVRDQVLTVEPGDADELVTNFAAAGDPTDTWWRPGAHGTAAQRQESFLTGYQNGIEAC